MANSNKPIDPSITEATVRHRQTVRPGDRVKHFGQRYNHEKGTATVVGFYEEPKGWVKVRVTPDDSDSLYGNTWDWDRTERVSGPQIEAEII